VSRAALTRTVLRAALVIAALFLVVAARVVTGAKAELEIAERHAQEGDLEAAIVHYRRAARWYAPFSPYHVQALAALGRIGADAEQKADVELALSAYRAVRSAILSTRSFYVQERERLDAADKRIASLMAGLPPPQMDAGKSREQLEQEHLALLQHDPDPKLGWTLLLLLGFAAWVGGAFAFTLRAIDSEDRFIRREAVRWGAVIVVGFALFVLGMTLA
jgi:tetratricopeptide (TPR) repeat protein